MGQEWTQEPRATSKNQGVALVRPPRWGPSSRAGWLLLSPQLFFQEMLISSLSGWVGLAHYFSSCDSCFGFGSFSSFFFLGTCLSHSYLSLHWLLLLPSGWSPLVRPGPLFLPEPLLLLFFGNGCLLFSSWLLLWHRPTLNGRCLCSNSLSFGRSGWRATSHCHGRLHTCSPQI